jgi:hypothetical protein
MLQPQHSLLVVRTREKDPGQPTTQTPHFNCHTHTLTLHTLVLSFLGYAGARSFSLLAGYKSRPPMPLGLS